MYDMVNKDIRKSLEKKRKEFLKLNIKKPTDIIIFLDSYAYSATSIFAKAIQNEGNAITVGFNGNPYLSDDLFDASQSPGPLYPFSDTEEYKNLQNLGFVVRAITMGESYENDYVVEKPTPREYKLDLVDERVDNYEAYSDDKYEIFIEEAKNIFKKYNEEGQCNPKNKKLVLYEEGKCFDFEDDKYAHGGYTCGDNEKWSTECRKYYCELGYYYNLYEKKCMKDSCTYESGKDDKDSPSSSNGKYKWLFPVLIIIGIVLVLLIVIIVICKVKGSKQKDENLGTLIDDKEMNERS